MNIHSIPPAFFKMAGVFFLAFVALWINELSMHRSEQETEQVKVESDEEVRNKKL